MPCVMALFMSGSPPRAWGKCMIRKGVRGGYRFTPTCVGKMV